jgi:hypothetical protein
LLHRCVYYKVGREHLQAVCAAVRSVQLGWVMRHRGLRAELLIRVDAAAASGPATVMEVWRWEPGEAASPDASPDWARLEHELGEAIAGPTVGPRHVEDFDAAPG